MVQLAITSNVLSGLISFLLPVVGIGFVIFLVVAAFKIPKGQITAKSAVLVSLGFVVLGGALLFAGTNFKAESETGKSIEKAVDKTTNKAAEGANGVIDGNGK